MKESGMKKEFRISTDLLKVQDASSEVLKFLKPLVSSDPLLFDVRLCLEEALINAMKYGNGLDRNKMVTMNVEFRREAVLISVEDQGEGFKPDTLRDCTEEENLLKSSGRGVHLMRRLMDKVEYNAKGNCVLMVKYLNKRSDI